MDALTHSERHALAIHQAAWLVRHYHRPAQRARRAALIRELGLQIRVAFNESEDFEPLLVAIVDGLRPTPSSEPF